MDSPNYQARLQAEARNYADCQNVEDLPPIFHYWSNRYVRPRLEEFGFSGPAGMFHKYVEEQCALGAGGTLRFLSVGSGNCELEIDLALRLRAQGHSEFVIDCLEINSAMLERSRVAAAQRGVAEHLNLIQDDFNEWNATEQYNAAIANQALHHVLNLEHLLKEIKASLKPRGRLIVSDMIGRNGHQLWPEALHIVHELWRKLPPSYRFNNQTRRYEELYVNEDYSRESFEAIRSQDILPLLLQQFHFELFIGFANLINPFVERSFGPHFDQTAPWDRNFIDEVQARDDYEILHSRIKPTHMLAVLRIDTGDPCTFHGPLSPESCVRPPELEEITPSTPSQDLYPWGAWPHRLQSEVEIACQRLSEAAHRIQNLKNQVDQIKSDLEKRTAWAWQCEKESEARTAWALQTAKENTELTALVEQLETDLKERTMWARQLHRDFEERTAWAQQLQKELDGQTASNIELNKQLEERTRWALQLREELEIAAAELERTAWIRSQWHRFRRLFGLHVRP